MLHGQNPEWWEQEHNRISLVQSESHILYMYAHPTNEGWEYALTMYKDGEETLLRTFFQGNDTSPEPEDTSLWELNPDKEVVYTQKKVGIGGPWHTGPEKVRIWINSGEHKKNGRSIGARRRHVT
tara:strand:- start:114 stop:488 length:375 start_codon:yes stop_codon:yes gene_type:complete